jgi:DNA-binding MarR family transcriptional regulator
MARSRDEQAPAAELPSEAESVSLWFRLLSCHAVLLATLRRELEGRVTLARFDVLASLSRDDGQTLAALSRALLVTAGNLTGLVGRAERDGVVERRPDPSDRRLARVWLTAKGRTLIRELLPVHAHHVHELVRGLPAPERRELRRLLGTLRDHLSPRPLRGSLARATPAVRRSSTRRTPSRTA